MYVYLSAIIFSLPLGSLIDKYGKRVYFFIGTMFCFLLTHLIFFGLPNCHNNQTNSAILGSILLGLSYSMYSNCLVPLFPLVVKHNIMGTAIGLLATF
jgi:MFS family permease